MLSPGNLQRPHVDDRPLIRPNRIASTQITRRQPLRIRSIMPARARRRCKRLRGLVHLRRRRNLSNRRPARFGTVHPKTTRCEQEKPKPRKPAHSLAKARRRFLRLRQIGPALRAIARQPRHRRLTTWTFFAAGHRSIIRELFGRRRSQKRPDCYNPAGCGGNIK